jgi:hypothetical protein
MSRILEFYRGHKTDIEGRTLEQLWAMNDDELEELHDYIQWLFPLPEPSAFNPDAPLLTEYDIAIFKSDPVIQANLRESYERILRFLGLALAEDKKVVEGDNFQKRISEVWEVFNHNWLRITRILGCLTLLGQEKQAKALYERLAEYVRTVRFPIPPDTFRYWTEAVEIS